MPHDVTGSGDPLVLIHGITESRRAWDPLVPALAEHHTVVAVDLPGHGEAADAASYDPLSMAAAVAKDVAAAGVGTPLVVGHSLGGVVASAYAASQPCRGVVNVDQPLRLAGFQEALRSIEPMLRGDQAAFEGAIHAVFESLAGPLAGAERARIEALRRPRQDVVLAIWSPVLDSSADDLDALIRSVAAGVKVPYLAIHGGDPGEGYAEWLHEIIPTSQVEIWDGLGHYPHLVDPDRFLARLAAFEQQL